MQTSDRRGQLAGMVVPLAGHEGRSNGAHQPPPFCATDARARSAPTSPERPTANATDEEYTPQASPTNFTRTSIGGKVGGRLHALVGPLRSNMPNQFSSITTPSTGRPSRTMAYPARPLMCCHVSGGLRNDQHSSPSFILAFTRRHSASKLEFRCSS